MWGLNGFLGFIHPKVRLPSNLGLQKRGCPNMNLSDSTVPRLHSLTPFRSFRRKTRPCRDPLVPSSVQNPRTSDLLETHPRVLATDLDLDRPEARPRLRGRPRSPSRWHQPGPPPPVPASTRTRGVRLDHGEAGSGGLLTEVNVKAWSESCLGCCFYVFVFFQIGTWGD